MSEKSGVLLTDIASSLAKSGDLAVQTYLRALGKANKQKHSNDEETELKRVYCPHSAQSNHQNYGTDQNRNACKKSESCDHVDDKLSRMQNQIMLQCKDLFKECISVRSTNQDIRHHAMYHNGNSSGSRTSHGNTSHNRSESSYLPKEKRQTGHSAHMKHRPCSISHKNTISQSKGHVRWQADEQNLKENGYESSSSDSSYGYPSLPNNAACHDDVSQVHDEFITCPSLPKNSLFLDDMRSPSVPYKYHPGVAESKHHNSQCEDYMCPPSVPHNSTDSQSQSIPIPNDSWMLHDISDQANTCTSHATENSQPTFILDTKSNSIRSKEVHPHSISSSYIVRKSCSEPALSQQVTGDHVEEIPSDSHRQRQSTTRNQKMGVSAQHSGRNVVHQHINPHVEQPHKHRAKFFTATKTKSFHCPKDSEAALRAKIYTTAQTKTVYQKKDGGGVDRHVAFAAKPDTRKPEVRPYTSINLPKNENWTKHVPKDPAMFSWKTQAPPPWQCEERSFKPLSGVNDSSNRKVDYCKVRKVHLDQQTLAGKVDNSDYRERSSTYYSHPQRAVIIRGQYEPPHHKVIKNKVKAPYDPCAHIRSRSFDPCVGRSYDPCVVRKDNKGNPYSSYAMNSAYLNPVKNQANFKGICETARPRSLMIYPDSPLSSVVSKYINC